MPKPKLVLCLLLISLLLTAAGCRAVTVTGGAGDSRQGGTVIVGLREEPANLNPLLWRPQDDIDIGSMIFSGLFRRNEAMEVIPDLALEIPTAANGGIKTDDAGIMVTYRLRPDVKWHDGTPFTADDVLFTYDAIRSNGTGNARYAVYASVTDIQAVNPQTVAMRLKRQDIDVTALFDRIVPAHILRGKADMGREAFSRRPVGTGPFSLEAWTPRDRLVLKANPGYFGKGPYLDSIIFKIIPDAPTLLNTLKTGQIDLYPRIEPEQITGLTEIYKISFHSLPSRQLDALVFHSGTVPDIRVRQAVLAAVDRSALAAEAYAGYGRAAAGFRADISRPAGETNLTGRETERAEQLLAEAGWLPGEDGIRTRYGAKLRIACTTMAGDALQEQAAAQLQTQLRDVGIELVPVPLAAPGYAAAIKAGSFETALVRYELPAEFNPFRLWHSSQLPPEGQNYGRYRNAQVDQLLEQARGLPDQAAREQAYNDAQAVVDAALPVISLVTPADVDAVSERLQDYRPSYADRLWNAAEWRIRVD